jgi:hypothetical protein
MPTVVKIVPVAKGAAEYLIENRGGKWYVVMYESERADGATVQVCPSEQAANIAAVRWQKKENRAVLQDQGYF